MIDYKQYRSSSSKPGDGFASAATSNTSKSNSSAGLLNDMLKSDSPLMQRASTEGRQTAQSRGLLNSSMAAGASQGAMIDRAQPFALQDSNNIYRENQFNAGEQNRMRMQQNDYLGRGQLADQGFTQQVGLNEQQYGNQRGLADQQFGFQTQLNDQQYDNQRGLAEQGFGFETQLNDQDLANTLERMQADYGFNSELSTQEATQSLDRLKATTTANGWGVFANNMTDIIGQYSNQIERVQMNPDMEEADKEQMIEQVLSMRDSDIEFQQSLYNELPNYLQNTGVFPDATSPTQPGTA